MSIFSDGSDTLLKKTTIGMSVIGVVAMLAVSGCGSSSGVKSSTPTTVSTAVTDNAKLGGAQVLVDSKGFTLYAFSKDPRNTFHSHCNSRCELTWPPLILSGSAPVAAGAAFEDQLGAIKLSDGELQVDYAGHPLHTYVLEKKPGEARGNGVESFGRSWHALTPQGTPVSR